MWVTEYFYSSWVFFFFCFLWVVDSGRREKHCVFHKRRPAVCFRVTSLHPAVHPTVSSRYVSTGWPSCEAVALGGREGRGRYMMYFILYLQTYLTNQTAKQMMDDSFWGFFVGRVVEKIICFCPGRLQWIGHWNWLAFSYRISCWLHSSC